MALSVIQEYIAQSYDNNEQVGNTIQYCHCESNIFLYHKKTKPYNIIIIIFIKLTSEIIKFDLLQY